MQKGQGKKLPIFAICIKKERSVPIGNVKALHVLFTFPFKSIAARDTTKPLMLRVNIRPHAVFVTAS